MKWNSETRPSAEIFWTNETFENRFWRQFPVYYRQINIIRGRFIWTSWRPRLKKLWRTGWNFWAYLRPNVRYWKPCWLVIADINQAIHHKYSVMQSNNYNSYRSALCQLNVVRISPLNASTVCVQSLSAARLVRCDAISSAIVLHGARYRAEYCRARTNTVQSPVPCDRRPHPMAHCARWGTA